MPRVITLTPTPALLAPLSFDAQLTSVILICKHLVSLQTLMTR